MSAINTAPVSVTVNADNTWQSYRSGVLTKNCGLFGQIDHAVIAVGYDSDASTIKIRNSWGSSWGEAGYVRVSSTVTDPYCLYKTAPFVAQISADVLSEQSIKHGSFCLLTADSRRVFLQSQD